MSLPNSPAHPQTWKKTSTNRVRRRKKTQAQDNTSRNRLSCWSQQKALEEMLSYFDPKSLQFMAGKWPQLHAVPFPESSYGARSHEMKDGASKREDDRELGRKIFRYFTFTNLQTNCCLHQARIYLSMASILLCAKLFAHEDCKVWKYLSSTAT